MENSETKGRKPFTVGPVLKLLKFVRGTFISGIFSVLLLTIHPKCLYVAHSISRSKFSLMVRASPTKRALATDVCV